MGIFDGNDDGNGNAPIPGGSLAKPVLIALGTLLVGKMLAGNRDDEPEVAAPKQVPHQAPDQTEADGGGLLGGILGGLGGLLGGTMAGNAQNAPDAPGPLSGGLGGLLDQLKQAGLGDTVDSWVGKGNNQAVEPDKLGSAIGNSTINDLAEKVGIDPQVLLDQLSKVLPGVVDKLTQDGKVPDTSELSRLLKNR